MPLVLVRVALPGAVPGRPARPALGESVQWNGHPVGELVDMRFVVDAVELELIVGAEVLEHRWPAGVEVTEIEWIPPVR